MSFREVVVVGLARAMFGWDSGSLFVLAAGMSPRTEGKLTLLLRAGMSLPLVSGKHGQAKNVYAAVGAISPSCPSGGCAVRSTCFASRQVHKELVEAGNAFSGSRR